MYTYYSTQLVNSTLTIIVGLLFSMDHAWQGVQFFYFRSIRKTYLEFSRKYLLGYFNKCGLSSLFIATTRAVSILHVLVVFVNVPGDFLYGIFNIYFLEYLNVQTHFFLSKLNLNIITWFSHVCGTECIKMFFIYYLLILFLPLDPVNIGS